LPSLEKEMTAVEQSGSGKLRMAEFSDALLRDMDGRSPEEVVQDLGALNHALPEAIERRQEAHRHKQREDIDLQLNAVFDKFGLSTERGAIDIADCMIVAETLCEAAGQEFNMKDGERKFTEADEGGDGKLGMAQFKHALLRDMDGRGPEEVVQALEALNHALPGAIERRQEATRDRALTDENPMANFAMLAMSGGDGFEEAPDTARTETSCASSEWGEVDLQGAFGGNKMAEPNEALFTIEGKAKAEEKNFRQDGAKNAVSSKKPKRAHAWNKKREDVLTVSSRHANRESDSD